MDPKKINIMEERPTTWNKPASEKTNKTIKSPSHKHRAMVKEKIKNMDDKDSESVRDWAKKQGGQVNKKDKESSEPEEDDDDGEEEGSDYEVENGGCTIDTELNDEDQDYFKKYGGSIRPLKSSTNMNKKETFTKEDTSSHNDSRKENGGTTSDTSIATEIRNQIGHKALYMLGAYDIFADKNALVFKIRGSKKWKHIKIALNGKNLYDVTFSTWRGGKLTNKTINDVYVDHLHNLIEEETGLYTHLEKGGEIESSLNLGDTYLVGIQYQTREGRVGQKNMEIVIDNLKNFIDEDDVINEANQRFLVGKKGYKIIGGDIVKVQNKEKGGMISKDKARDIASNWHGGQHSALYQFSSSGIYLPGNHLKYLREVQTDMEPEYYPNPGVLSKKNEKELNSLKKFFEFKGTENGMGTRWEKHPQYGYMVPFVIEDTKVRVKPLHMAMSAGGTISDYYIQDRDFFIDKETFQVTTREDQKAYQAKSIEDAKKWIDSRYEPLKGNGRSIATDPMTSYYEKGGRAPGSIGKSGKKYSYTLQEYEKAGKKKGLFVSPAEYWKSQVGSSYTDFIGRKQIVRENEKDRIMTSYAYQIQIGIDLGSKLIPDSAKKYAEEKYPLEDFIGTGKMAVGGTIRKAKVKIPKEPYFKYVTVQRELPQTIITEEGIFPKDDIIKEFTVDSRIIMQHGGTISIPELKQISQKAFLTPEYGFKVVQMAMTNPTSLTRKDVLALGHYLDKLDKYASETNNLDLLKFIADLTVSLYQNDNFKNGGRL